MEPGVGEWMEWVGEGVVWAARGKNCRERWLRWGSRDRTRIEG